MVREPIPTSFLTTIGQVTDIFRTAATFEEQIESILALGTHLFDLDLGMLTRVRGESLEVRSVFTRTDLRLAPGDAVNLSDTCCRETLCAEGPVWFEEPGGRAASAPTFGNLHLQAYIGAPIRVDGETWGTLSFSSPAARPRRFRVEDICVLELLGTWVGASLEMRGRAQSAEQLAAEQRKRNDALQKLAGRLAEANTKLSLENRWDPLTGVLNRGAWEESLTIEHDRAARHDGVYSVVMLDIDCFKALNDALGHQTGDACLHAVAHCIQRSVRAHDLVGRYGGEEFAILLPETPGASALLLAERIRSGIVELGLEHPNSRAGSCVTASLGVAEGPLDSPGMVIARADELLYVAKASGRNRVCDAPVLDPVEDEAA